MKSTNIKMKIIYITISCLLISFCLSLQTKTKKTQTMMEFFNNMFLSETQNQTIANNTTKEPDQPVMISDWLQISSYSFKNIQKYPHIPLPNGTEVPIKVNSDFFRINYAFPANKNDGSASELEFFFRLSGTHLYYTITKTDLNVLGAISISDMIDETNSIKQEYCFAVRDDFDRSKWTLCSKSEVTKTKWVCAIKKALGQNPLPSKCLVLETKANVTEIESTVIEQKTIQPIILIPLPSRKCNSEWNYDNHGKDWECTCSDGVEQSPIDLPSISESTDSPVTPVFQYEEVDAKSILTTIDGYIKSQQYIKIKFFANSLRIFHPNLGKIVTLDGTVYVAEEIVFHTPSEHTINGKKFDMEMQIIHYGQSKGDIAKQAVVSFLFQKKAGVYNKFFDDVDFFDLPNPSFTERDITNNLFIPKVFYSSSDSAIPVMKPFSFYTYTGSITFPPCTERTIHYVASEPIPIASAPLELIKEALKKPDIKDDKDNMFLNIDEPENNREIQPRNGRPVFFYDHNKYCPGDKMIAQKNTKSTGHYEKVPKKITQYFFVNGEEPSGLPSAFVVDEKEAKGLLN